ncbi:MAG: BMC domain-containing protein [Candidatus Adiutrix sp.]|jgi:microcompartment protein CcmL/EutN|nr:BMC domain-containing protein [Candidatus Adiutrix sp.]
MSTALGLLEFKTIPVAVEAADEMLKAAEVELILATPICPGKYVAIISGEVANVQSSVKRGVAVGGIFLVDSYVIPNISEAVLPAISGAAVVDHMESLGVIETIAAVSAVMAGDLIVKAAQVQLIEIRLARGLGGKGEVFFTGELGAVEAARNAALERLGREGGLVSSAVIARPHKALLQAIA